MTTLREVLMDRAAEYREQAQESRIKLDVAKGVAEELGRVALVLGERCGTSEDVDSLRRGVCEILGKEEDLTEANLLHFLQAEVVAHRARVSRLVGIAEALGLPYHANLEEEVRGLVENLAEAERCWSQIARGVDNIRTAEQDFGDAGLRRAVVQVLKELDQSAS